MVEAYVFCHECGAQGPCVDELIYSIEECKSPERQAVSLWQERTAKNRNLFDSGESRGLNQHPRADEK